MKRIRAKYIKIDDKELISSILNHLATRLNCNPLFRYNYYRDEHWLTMKIRINGRWLTLNADVTKSDIIEELDRILRYIV
jgi:hypothetical protein